MILTQKTCQNKLKFQSITATLYSNSKPLMLAADPQPACGWHSSKQVAPEVLLFEGSLLVQERVAEDDQQNGTL